MTCVFAEHMIGTALSMSDVDMRCAACGGSMHATNIQCVYLGHGFEDGKALDYFGLVGTIECMWCFANIGYFAVECGGGHTVCLN